MFIISALFFIAASLRAGDIVSLFGGLFFLIACIVFLIPFFYLDKPTRSILNK